jgi:hypothetical protein
VPILSGTDKFGDFKLRQGKCGHCGKNTTRVDFLSFQLPGNIDPQARTLIVNITPSGNYVRDSMPKLGVTCGCYGTFHRQIARISSRQDR